jgi:hypothetical protein
MVRRLAALIPVFLGLCFAPCIVAYSQCGCNDGAAAIESHRCPGDVCQSLFSGVNGWGGRPWRDPVPGGCRCGKKCGATHYNFSNSWPSPFSVLLDYGGKGDAWRCTADTRNSRLRDGLDVLASVRLLAPLRRDNGYCGPDCDLWGHVGRSQQLSSGTTVEWSPETAVATPAPAPVPGGSSVSDLRQGPPDAAGVPVPEAVKSGHFVAVQPPPQLAVASPRPLAAAVFSGQGGSGRQAVEHSLPSTEWHPPPGGTVWESSADDR